MNEFVVGVDGSDHSRMALQWAAAAGNAARVPVRAVQSWIHPRSAALPLAPVPVSAEEMDEQTQQAITATAADTLGSSAAVTIDVLRGPPAGALLQTVTPDSVLVLGSRGLGGFAGLLLGSVSQECVEYASCPVVVVRTDRIVGDGDVILVGKDGSEGAKRALTWAVPGVCGRCASGAPRTTSSATARPTSPSSPLPNRDHARAFHHPNRPDLLHHKRLHRHRSLRAVDLEVDRLADRWGRHRASLRG